MMTRLVALLLITTLNALCSRPDSRPLSADEIMAKVAENQDRAVKERASYVYEQKIHVASRRTNGKLLAEVTSVYAVAPSDKGVTRQVKSFVGRSLKKGKYIEYPAQEEMEHAGGIDPDVVASFERDFAEEKSKDGLGKDLFPLTSDQQKDYQFQLSSEREVKGRRAYVILFGPKDRNEFTWAGEAWVDKTEFQPIHVATKLSRRLPVLVRTMLGTDVPGLGFNVEYQRFEEGVWFPVSFGTEFRVHAVFFFNRAITVALDNSQFKKVQVDSSIQFADVH
jgi:hypothetical protein